MALIFMTFLVSVERRTRIKLEWKAIWGFSADWVLLKILLNLGAIVVGKKFKVGIS